MHKFLFAPTQCFFGAIDFWLIALFRVVKCLIEASLTFNRGPLRKGNGSGRNEPLTDGERRRRLPAVPYVTYDAFGIKTTKTRRRTCRLYFTLGDKTMVDTVGDDGNTEEGAFGDKTTVTGVCGSLDDGGGGGGNPSSKLIVLACSNTGVVGSKGGG